MRSNFKLLLLLCNIAVIANAQNEQSTMLNIGDSAPPLRVREWIKGTPIQSLEKGKVYVLEFWATWCKPCIAAMPHLSDLASEYKDKVTFINISIYEKKTTSIKKVKAFVDSMGNRMNFYVAVEDSIFTVADWLESTGEKNSGIPRTFVVDEEGRLAWMGHPKDLDEVLRDIVNDRWDIKQALAERNLNKQLTALDDSLNYELMRYTSDQFRPGDLGKPDSALLAINEIVSKEPRLKYAPFIASHTFSALLKIDQHKAYEYGEEFLATPAYKEPDYDALIGTINSYSSKLILQAEIYQLGAEAYQAKIEHLPYPEIVNISRLYKNMADMYWRAKNRLKAIEAQQKAIEALKSKKDFSKKDMAAFEFLLQQYKNL